MPEFPAHAQDETNGGTVALVTALAFAVRCPDGRDKPGHDDVVFRMVPALRSGMKNAAPRPGHASRTCALPNPRGAAISPAFIRSNPREICMTIMYSQIASSRPKLMLDVIVAR
jgi:hypothetical protein